MEYPLMEYYSAIKRTIHTGNTDKPQNNYAEWMKPDKKGVHPIWFHLGKILENAN